MTCIFIYLDRPGNFETVTDAVSVLSKKAIRPFKQQIKRLIRDVTKCVEPF